MERDILKTIHELRFSFLREYGKKPNVVYMGHREIDELKLNYTKFAPFHLHDFIERPGLPEKSQVFGIPIEIVAKENYLAVGYVLEEFNQ